MEPVYWSVDECRWVRQFMVDELWLVPVVPQPRAAETAVESREEPVEA